MANSQSSDVIVNLESINFERIFKNAEINTNSESALHQDCAQRYNDHLASRFPSWQSEKAGLRIPTVLRKMEDDLAPQIYQMMDQIADDLVADGDANLPGLVHNLQSKGYFTQDELSFSDACRLVFILLGEMTMLYEPDIEKNREYLGIQAPEVFKSRRNFQKRRGESTFQQPMGQATLPFRDLLRTFENVLPQPRLAISAEFTQSQTSETLYTDSIVISNIGFDVLDRIGQVKIHWTRSLSRHLAFDERSRILELFEFPSYCALVCASKPETVAFGDCFVFNPPSNENSSTAGATGADTLLWSDFCREILITYGVIFGRAKRSRRAFERMTEQWIQEQYQGTRISDVFLREICTNQWETSTISGILESSTIKSTYSATKDLPFLGSRLLILQDYMNAQNPSDLRFLLHDRRDILRFYTFWAVIVLGAFSTVLGFFQVLLAIASLGVSIKQIV